MEYPEHEFSKYIDTTMSFTNEISYPTIPANDKSNLVYQLKNIRCDGGLSLEPRLQEYMKKKKRYKDNNIKPCISLEREFQITRDDLNKIKAFLKGKRNQYTPEQSWLKKNICLDKQSFPSKDFRDNDSRVIKPNKPDKNEDVINRGMFYPGSDKQYYEDPLKEESQLMDARDFTSGFNLDSRFDPRTDPRMYPGNETANINPHMSQYKVRHQQIDPKIKKRIRRSRRRSKKNLSGYIDICKEKGACQDHDDKPIYRKTPGMEREEGYVVPKIAHEANRNINQHLSTNGYLDPTQEYGDVGLETCMIHGMPSRTLKSYGFRNPVEHYFQYIDDDIQNPNNVVFPIPRGGISTRIDNAKQARPYYRDVM